MERASATIISEYIDLYRDFEAIVREQLITAVRERWPWSKRQLFLNRMSTRLKELNAQAAEFDDLLGLEYFYEIRQRLSNSIFVNTYSFLRNEIPTVDMDLLEDKFKLNQIATKLDDVLNISYKDGSRHNAITYLDGVLQETIAREDIERSVNRMIREKILFAQVSTNETSRTCYLCQPWLGTVGTIGQDVPGYPRLDGLFPRHGRCIHYLIPFSGGELHVAPEWAWTADKNEYYKRFVSTEEGKRAQAELNHIYYMNSKPKRIQQIKRAIL
jgi:hypothetical protein